jgi:hypothetical protein
LRYYNQQRAKGASFKDGIRVALESVLANPQFIFRFEKLQRRPRLVERGIGAALL